MPEAQQDGKYGKDTNTAIYNWLKLHRQDPKSEHHEKAKHILAKKLFVPTREPKGNIGGLNDI